MFMSSRIILKYQAKSRLSSQTKCPLFTVTPNLEIDLFLGDMTLLCSSSCGFKANSKRYLEIHIKAIRHCQLCQKEFHGSKSSQDYKRHLHKHKKEAQGRIIYHCKFCNKYFEAKFNYQRHSNSRKCLNNQANYYKVHIN